jgi:ferredoxin
VAARLRVAAAVGFPSEPRRAGARAPGRQVARSPACDRPAQARCLDGSYPLKSARVWAVCTIPAVTYVIAGSCIKDDSCIEVCPVDCIHPKPGAPDFETVEQLYIDPDVCIDCDACVEACPIDAIFADFELPDKYEYALEVNAEFFAEQSTAERTAA